MKQIPNALTPLTKYKQWMCYKLVPSSRKPGKFDKFPVNPKTGNIVDAHDPSHWTDSDTAVTAAGLWGDGFGVAFVFTSKDPFFFVDIDAAYDGVNWSEHATNLCGMFPGAAIEVSQSKTGLHIIGSYSGDEPDHACKNVPLGLELYTSARFCALTGVNMTGDASTTYDIPLGQTINHYFPYQLDTGGLVNWSDQPVEGYRPIKDDQKLIEKMLETKSTAAAFGKASFADLWTRNVEALANTYPDDIRDFDASSADAALAQHLVWWTCGDCERVERLMRESALVREKWDWHKKYLKTTILGSLAKTKRFYEKGSDVQIIDQPTSSEAAATIREGSVIMSPEQQITYFKGCVYINSVVRIYTPSGDMMKQEQFNSMFNGHEFALDMDLSKSTKKAWEAFTGSMCVTFPKVDSWCFRPMLPQGVIVSEEGQRLVNTYKPIETGCAYGDVTPFTSHLELLLPDARDREILLSYMAACIQFKGYKIQWAPLIQGVEGNGKTLFTRCLAHAIGQRYTHMPPANEISEKFNSWLFGNLFVGVEDIYVPAEKREILETLKPMITNNRLARRAMNTDQTMGDVCCNFIFNSNHKDAVAKTENDRRFCVFYTAQQDVADIARDGMDGDYFPNLYEWLDNGGYDLVHGYLESYTIADEFNPTTTCQRAPKTSSTSEAVAMSLGSVEQEIMEAVEEGRQGFAGGWVSSFAIDQLLKDMRKDRQIPQNRRRKLMKSLGYDYHPSLNDGRVNNAISIDGGKPRLFIKIGHIHCNLATPADVARYYAAAQGDPLAKQSVDNAVSIS